MLDGSSPEFQTSVTAAVVSSSRIVERCVEYHASKGRAYSAMPDASLLDKLLGLPDVGCAYVSKLRLLDDQQLRAAAGPGTPYRLVGAAVRQ